MQIDWLSGRSLRRPLLLSLGLHCLVLSGVQFESSQRGATGSRLQATLSNRPSEAAIVPSPAKPAKAPKQAPVSPRLSVSAADDHRIVTAAGAPVLPSPSIAPAAAAAPQGMAAAAPVPAIMAEAAPASAGAQPAQISAEGLRLYRLQLAREARRFKHYPQQAREHGWEGTSEVTVNASSALSVPTVALTRSSGYAVLDEQALEMIGQAVRLVALPELLRGRDFRMPIPVRFGLDD